MQKERIHQGDVLPLRYQSHPIHISPLGGTHWVFVPLQIILYLVGISTGVFLQIKPGKDYFGFRHLIATTLLMMGYYWCITLFRDNDTTTFLIFISVFFGVGLSWRCLSLYKTIMEIPMHTRDRGQYFIWGWLPFKNPYWIYAWVLPIFTLSAAAWVDDWTLRTWLIISGVALLLRANINAFFVQLAKESITNSAAQWETISQKHTAQGNSETPSTSRSIEHAPTYVKKPTIDTALGNLDPRLKTLLDKD